MTADKVIAWDGKKAFEIILLVATAVVMTAAVFDVVPSTDTPAPLVEQAAPGSYGTANGAEAPQPGMQATALPQEETGNGVKQTNPAEKNTPLH